MKGKFQATSKTLAASKSLDLAQQIEIALIGAYHEGWMEGFKAAQAKAEEIIADQFGIQKEGSDAQR